MTPGTTPTPAPHDLSLKPGWKTTEFWWHALATLVVIVQWLLSELHGVGPKLPPKWAALDTSATGLLTTLLGISYSIQRSKQKIAALSQVVKFNDGVGDALRSAQRALTSGGYAIGAKSQVVNSTDVKTSPTVTQGLPSTPAAPAPAAESSDAGDINLDTVNPDDLS